jgi:hypothetical protein
MNIIIATGIFALCARSVIKIKNYIEKNILERDFEKVNKSELKDFEKVNKSELKDFEKVNKSELKDFEKVNKSYFELKDIDISDVIQGEKFQTLVNNKTIFYCHTHDVNTFFENINFTHDFILISHNSDAKITDKPGKTSAGYLLENGNSPDADVKKIPKNLKKWFGQNVDFESDLIVSLPIGLENKYNFPKEHKIKKLFAIRNKEKCEKNLVYLNVNIMNNPKERQQLYDMLNDKKYVTIQYGKNGLNYDSYLLNVYNHSFMICPEGNGIDVHQIWESLYIGTIPIQKKILNNINLRDLPICFLDQWEQLKDETFLRNEYKRIISKQYDLSKLRFDYWKQQIISTSNNLCKNVKIVLVMLNNLQSYIFDNIDNLKKHNNNDIAVITDKKFQSLFENLGVDVIYIEDLIFSYTEYTKKIKNSFRNGFWELTSFRFFAIYSYMKKYNLENIVHIENDVLIYTYLDYLKFHNREKLLLTMDSEKRCIPGIMFIPNNKILFKCLNTFNEKLNDMENFSICYYKLPEYVDTLPIFIDIDNNTNNILNIITKNFKYYNSIFDAAAIGQYLGGIDPENKSGNTIGFINETCVIDYSKYTFHWKNNNVGLKIPYININNNEYPIINLHIHCKNLKKFIS